MPLAACLVRWWRRHAPPRHRRCTTRRRERTSPGPARRCGGAEVSAVFTDPTELTVCGGPVRVYTGGQSGPVLLLLHGAMLDTAAGVWRRVGPALAGEHRVVAVDLPRHGGSRPWRGVLDDAFFRR